MKALIFFILVCGGGKKDPRATAVYVQCSKSGCLLWLDESDRFKWLDGLPKVFLHKGSLKVVYTGVNYYDEWLEEEQAFEHVFTRKDKKYIHMPLSKVDIVCVSSGHGHFCGSVRRK